MRLWHIIRTRTASLLLRRRREAELREELQQHIERETERLQASGLTPDAARQQALRHFGGVEWAKEQCRDARGTARLDSLGRDTRYAIRRLIRDWRFTAAAVSILGLGIGANTAIFSLVNASLFRGQALAEPHRLVDLYQNGSNRGGVDGNSYPAYLDMAASTDVFAGTTAALVPSGVNYLDAGVLRPAVAEHTTASYLSVLGLQPSLGRWFTAAEDVPGAAVVAVLGHEAWRRKFGSAPSVIGRTIRIDSVPVTIVGVGPAGHRATIDLGIVTDFWLPISSLPALGAPPRTLTRRPEEAAFSVKARLRDGVTVEQAQAAMSILGTRLAAEYPQEDPGRGIAVYASSDVRVHPQMDGLLRAVASILLVVVGLVLAIACSNLATLLLVRGTARVKEISVRLALGATRGQLVRHLLTENLMLSAGGCIAGCLLAWWAIRSLAAIDLPMVVDLSLDYRVLAFAVAISLVTGVAFGLAPALKATRVDLVPTLRGDGETRLSENRWLTVKNALVVVQVMVSVLLLGGTSLFLQLLHASRTMRTGFAVDGVAMIETDTRYAGYSAILARAGARGGSTARGRDARRAIGGADAWAAHGPDWRARDRRGREGDGRPGRWLAPGHGHLGGARVLRRHGDSHPVRTRPRRAGCPGCAARRGDQREHGAAVLRRGRRSQRGRPPVQARGGRVGGRLDRGGRRGAGHQDLARRSDAAGFLPVVRPVGSAADDRGRPHLPRRRGPRRRDAARAAHGERHAARRLGQDDGASSRGVADCAEGGGDVPRRVGSAGPVPGRDRALRRRRLRRVAPVP